MDHEVENGPITIIKVVNPCLYWIRCSKCLSSKEMDKILSHSCKLTPISSLQRNVERGDKVVVRFFDGRFLRGVVQHPDPILRGKKEHLRYKVYLVDLTVLMIIEPQQIFVIDNDSFMNDLSEQLHLVAIEFGKPLGNLESGHYMDEKSHNEHQRKQVLDLLKDVESIDFLPKGNYESLVFGKIKLWGKEMKNLNLLRLLIQSSLAQYRVNWITDLQMTEWMDKIMEEQKATQELLSPPPLPEIPKTFPMDKLPPPPDVVYNTHQMIQLKELTKLGETNLLDKVVPNLKVESFEEMNRRYKSVSRFEAILRKKAQPSKVQKFEYVINTEGVQGCLVDLEIDDISTSQVHPPTSSDDECSISSHYVSSTTTDLLPHDSDPISSLGSGASSATFKPSNVKFNDLESCEGEYSSLNKDVPSEPIRDSKSSELHSGCILKESITFGRGRLFENYLSARSENINAPSLSVIEPVDDSQFENSIEWDDYDDVCRMDRHGEDSPEPIRPSRSSSEDTLLLPKPAPPYVVIEDNEISLEESLPSPAMSHNSSVSSNYDRSNVISNTKEGFNAKEVNYVDSCPQGSTPIHVSSAEVTVVTNRTGMGRGKLLSGFIDSNNKYGSVPVESKTTNESKCISVSPTTPVLPKVSGRGLLFQKPLGPVVRAGRGASVQISESGASITSKVIGNDGIPTNAVTSASPAGIAGKSLPQKTKNGSSSMKEGDSSDNPRLAQLQAALQKMKMKENAEFEDDNESDSETTVPQHPAPTKVDLSEFVEKETVLDAEEDPEVAEETNLPTNLRDDFMAKVTHNLKSGSGLLHGATDILPVNYLSNVDLNENVYQNAKYHKISFLTRPQSLGIPAVLKMRNVVLVGPNKSKKSSAILIPLLSLLMNEEYYSALRKGLGPRCVIVAPTSHRVRTLSSLCAKYGGGRLMTIITHGGGLELERKNDLASGCDILITTPRCWLRLLQYPTVTNLSRLCHLVFDRYDILADNFADELKQITYKIEDLVKIRKRRNDACSSLGVQTILNAEMWSGHLEEMTTNFLKDPVVVITSYLEAILYAKIKPKLTLVKSEARFNKLVDLVQANSSKKTIIVSASAAEVTKLRGACSAHFVTIVAHENMVKSLIQDAGRQWHTSKDAPILVCSDAVLNELGITDADVLIHFSLPGNKSSFCDRFSVLRDYIPDRILFPNVSPPKCVVHILIDDACETPFPFMMDFFTRISAKIPPQMMEAVAHIERKKEEQKVDVPFCDEILHIGSCYKISSCKSRHVVLPEVDMGQVASKGWIKVQIIHVLTPIKFAARILAHNLNLTGGAPWTTFKSDFVTLNLKIASHYSSPRNRKQHGRPKVGDVLAYQEEMDSPFHRARVVQITKRDDRQEPTQVELFLIDEGTQLKSPRHALYELPEDLKKYRDQAVFIYLANLRPVDLDTTWSSAVQTMVRGEIHKSEIEDVANQDIIGKILFTIGPNYVVDNLSWFRTMTYSKCFTLDLRHLLLSSGYALDNSEYSSNLSELCAAANMEIGLFHGNDHESSSALKIADCDGRKEPPRWAHLSHGEEFIQVQAIADDSPSLFYVKMKRFHDNLVDLEKDLSVLMNANKKKSERVDVGGVFAVTCPSNEQLWNRCMVRSISENYADIFYVDYGDEGRVATAELYSIPWKFVNKLPFQAIECRLAGVTPGNPVMEWPKDAIYEFHNFFNKSEDFSEFYVKVMDLDLKASKTGGRCYHVILLDIDGEVPVIINKSFVERGYGALTSLDMDESEIFEAFRQSLQDDEENWDDVPSSPIPTLASQGLETQASESKLLDFDIDAVDADDLLEFVKMLTSNENITLNDDVFLEETQINMRQMTQPPLRQITEGPHQNVSQSTEPETTALLEGNQQPLKTNLKKTNAGAGKDETDTTNRREVATPTVPNVEANENERILVRCAPLKSPLIYWKQDASSVTIKYMIPCLQHYKIDVSVTTVVFRAIVNSDSGTDEYWKRIHLFGPVREKNSSVTLTVSCLRIKIIKALQGYLWPRLTHANTKHHLIKADPDDDTLLGNEEPDLFFERGFRKFTKQTRNISNKQELRPYESDDEDDDEEQFFEPETDDPHDPFG